MTTHPWDSCGGMMILTERQIFQQVVFGGNCSPFLLGALLIFIWNQSWIQQTAENLEVFLQWQPYGISGDTSSCWRGKSLCLLSTRIRKIHHKTWETKHHLQSEWYKFHHTSKWKFVQHFWFEEENYIACREFNPPFATSGMDGGNVCKIFREWVYQNWTTLTSSSSQIFGV
jgi:hypothetical protein